jgi:phosphate-selective porin
MDFSGSRTKLLDSELSYHLHSALVISAGQFKIPFSHENLTSVESLQFIQWSQVVDALCSRGKDITGNQCGRDIGLRLTGSLSRRFHLDYLLALMNGSGINTDDTNASKDIAGRVVIHPADHIGIGGSYYTGSYTQLAQDVTRTRMGMEFSYKAERFSCLAEYIRGRDDDSHRSGWFIQTGYFMTDSKIEGLLKLDVYDPDEKILGDISRIFIFGVNILFEEKSRLQLNYMMSEKNQDSVIAQLQFAF